MDFSNWSTKKLETHYESLRWMYADDVIDEFGDFVSYFNHRDEVENELKKRKVKND